MKILIVDDERFNLIVAEEYIKSLNLADEILLCKNPFEVVDTIIKESVDVVLLDIMMPDKSGIEVLEDIRSIPLLKDVQVIMLTALSDSESFKLCFEKGADDYLKKPVDIMELQARLSAAIKTRANSELLKEMFRKLKVQNSELKELNKTLKETQLQVIQNEKMASIGGLAAGIAHEINNPMGFISSNVETLENYIGKLVKTINFYKNCISKVEEDGGQNLMEHLNEAKAEEKRNKVDLVLSEMDGLFADTRDGVERVTKIVRTLRNFARTGFEDESQYNDLNLILEEALLILRNELKYSIIVEKDFGDVSNILCNKGQIGQVALNLLVNSIQAIKTHNPDESGHIFIKTFMEGEKACFSIADDGPGIPEDHLLKVFDPFFTTKEVGTGTGLGLSISQDIIINKHKGQIIIENNSDGIGAICIVKIPKLDKLEVSDEEDSDSRR